LVAGAEAGPVIAMEVFVEKDEITQVLVLLELNRRMQPPENAQRRRAPQRGGADEG
jgi:hypothetical protein